MNGHSFLYQKSRCNKNGFSSHFDTFLDSLNLNSTEKSYENLLGLLRNLLITDNNVDPVFQPTKTVFDFIEGAFRGEDSGLYHIFVRIVTTTHCLLSWKIRCLILKNVGFPFVPRMADERTPVTTDVSHLALI